MPGRLRSPVYCVAQVNAGMSRDCTYRLTHPEVMSEAELRDILRNSCIDFSNFEKLCRSELIEMYKRIAMPLPQRQSEGAQNSATDNKNSTNDFDKYSDTLSNSTHTLKRSLSDSTKMSHSSNLRSKSPANECNSAPKKIRLAKAKSGSEFNGVDKRTNDGKHDESPLKKRQKITWP